VRQSRHSKQRNDGPLCGKRVHAAAGHCCDAMEYLQGNPGGVRVRMKVSAIAASAMLIPRRLDPVMPASEETVMASLIRGLGIAVSALATTRSRATRR